MVGSDPSGWMIMLVSMCVHAHACAHLMARVGATMYFVSHDRVCQVRCPALSQW